ncbi:hypothetical protein DFH09DRAFT_1337560 [Mycena vulgaris]|nr:hypothetical protein DFH09DRAFT_1337560 [Mycena vulgaris]
MLRERLKLAPRQSKHPQRPSQSCWPAPPAAPAQALPGPTTAPQVFHLLSHAANAVATTVNAATVSPCSLPPLASACRAPWVAGNLYGVVPGGPLTPVPDHSEKWYAITKGRFVGVTSSTAIADGAAAALAAFNSALALNLGLVEVIGCRQKKRGYVVFYGRIPGVYAHWNGPHGAEAQVKGIKGSLYQGYTLLDNATEAFNYARARGWTAPSNFAAAQPIINIGHCNTPHAQRFAPRPGSSADSKWHIVYAGITPGIYRSFLECALNTIGLSCAVYDSTPSRTEAIARWQEAVDAGRVRTLTHPYIVQ